MYTMTPFEKKHFDLLNAFHDFENDFFAGTGWSTCKVDVRDEGDKFVMEAELPGFEKEDIHLDVQGDCLKLSAEHHTDSEDKDDKKKYIRKERSEVSYQRSFDLTGIDAEKLDAEYKNAFRSPVFIAFAAQLCCCNSSFRSAWISVRHCSSSGLNAPHSPFRIICIAFSWEKDFL